MESISWACRALEPAHKVCLESLRHLRPCFCPFISCPRGLRLILTSQGRPTNGSPHYRGHPGGAPVLASQPRVPIPHLPVNLGGPCMPVMFQICPHTTLLVASPGNPGPRAPLHACSRLISGLEETHGHSTCSHFKLGQELPSAALTTGCKPDALRAGGGALFSVPAPPGALPPTSPSPSHQETISEFLNFI